jgi:hypothetical protein
MDKIGILRRKETWDGGREFFLTCAYIVPQISEANVQTTEATPSSTTANKNNHLFIN